MVVHKILPRWVSRWLERGDETEDLPAVDLEHEAKSELKYLLKLGDEVQVVGNNTTTWSSDPSELPPADPETSSLKPFQLRPQRYTSPVGGKDSLVASGKAVIYDAVEDPQYALANVPVLKNPRDLTDEQRERLKIASAQVGEPEGTK